MEFQNFSNLTKSIQFLEGCCKKSRVETAKYNKSKSSRSPELYLSETNYICITLYTCNTLEPE